MASKKGKPMKNAQAQNAVSERRLRPIYGKFKLCIAWIFFIVSLLSADKFQLLLIPLQAVSFGFEFPFKILKKKYFMFVTTEGERTLLLLLLLT